MCLKKQNVMRAKVAASLVHNFSKLHRLCQYIEKNCGGYIVFRCLSACLSLATASFAEGGGCLRLYGPDVVKIYVYVMKIDMGIDNIDIGM